MPSASGYATGDILYDLGLDSTPAIKRQLRGEYIESVASAVGFIQTFKKSRGSSIVQSGDDIGTILFQGWNGTAYNDAVAIIGEIDGTPGASADMPGRLSFWTTPDGSATVLERLRIDATGQVIANPTLAATPFANFRSNTNDGAWGFYAHQYGANTSGAAIGLKKSRGTTVGSFGLVSASDILGFIGFNATDATQDVQSATIVATVEGTPGTGTVPARLDFRTAVQGNSFATERLRIDNTGQIIANQNGSTAIGFGVFFQANSVDGTNNPGAFVANQYSNDATGIYMGFYKSRGTTVGANGIVVLNDNLGGLYWNANTGSGSLASTSIQGYCDATPTSGQRVAGRLGFYMAVTNVVQAERVRFASDGNCTFHGSTSGGGANISVSGYNGVVQAIKDDAASGWNFSAVKYTNGTEGALMSFAKSRGTSKGTNTIVTNGDEIGRIAFYGNNGSSWTTAAMIHCDCNGTPGATNDMPGRIVLATTADGSGSATDNFLVSPSAQVMLINISTTASAANAFLDSANFNNVLRSTSSLRYKRDVEPVADANRDAVLAFNPIWYRSKARDDNPNHSFYGLAAEEVAAIDPRLCHWAYLDEDYEWYDTPNDTRARRLKEGAKLVPDAVMYDRVAILQIAALYAQIKEIKQKIGL